MNYPVVFVTGSSRGIGRAIALRFAQSKHSKFHIAINCAHQKEELEELGAVCGIYFGDLSNYQEACRIFSEIQSELGNISILVNNAGITKDNLLLKMSEEDFDRVIDTNLKGAFQCTKHVAKQMIKQRSGRIINISSVCGIIGNAGQANYCAAKAGMIGLTKSAAREPATRVN